MRALSLQYSAVARPLTALSTVLCWIGPPQPALRWEQSWAYWVPQAAHLLARLIATANSCIVDKVVNLSTVHVMRPDWDEQCLQGPTHGVTYAALRGATETPKKKRIVLTRNNDYQIDEGDDGIRVPCQEP